jgi:transcriptional regulator with XRE-family HTH domain
MKASQNQVALLAAEIKKRWTIKDFADEVGCSPSHVRNMIAGRKQPSLKLLQRMAATTRGRVNHRTFPKAAE